MLKAAMGAMSFCRLEERNLQIPRKRKQTTRTDT